MCFLNSVVPEEGKGEGGGRWFHDRNFQASAARLEATSGANTNGELVT